MSAMGEMISMIAHQWKQPLASIAAIADVELRTKKMEDELGTFIHVIGFEVKI